VSRGTANVFADLEFPDAVERQIKLRLAYAPLDGGESLVEIRDAG
jgi:hypothetical protein